MRIFLTATPLTSVTNFGSANIYELSSNSLANTSILAGAPIILDTSITKVVTVPLALCDSQTVALEDLVVFEIHYHDRVGENYFAKNSPKHAWYYYPEITHDEALLIKQWDSAGELAVSEGKHADADTNNHEQPCTFSFHSAFKDPATPDDAPDRWSIEVRCIVLY